MLVITLLMMGLVSIAVGLMPTAQTIGVAAPILLTVLRVIQASPSEASGPARC